jgi:hypothetical protein
MDLQAELRRAVPTESNKKRLVRTMIYIPRFDSFKMASTKTRISFEGWITITAVVLIVASAIGMICVDQDNRASIEECNKHIECCSSSLNPQFAEMNADASFIRAVRAAPDGKSPPELELHPGTSTGTLQTRSVPPERGEATIVPKNRN